MDAFLCVRPASAAAPSAVNDFAVGQLDRFAKEFPPLDAGGYPSEERSRSDAAGRSGLQHSCLRHTLHESNDRARFGFDSDPLDSRFDHCGEPEYDAAHHMLSMIYPNPANRRRYVVINSGHTFHEADFQGTNALLYPHIGDWAITDVRTGTVVAEGSFNRNWQLAQ
jgi:hypothetical protein